MATEFLSGLLQFVIRHKLIVAFYLAVLLLIFAYRKKFKFYFKVIAVCRTTLGLGLMDRIASRHSGLVKLLGYIGIGAGFLSMLFIVIILVQSVFVLLTVPDAASPISPVLPGVRVPGVPQEFFVPFVQGIIAIFIIAVVHEFAHGVVARAHDVKVKSSGPAVIGPVFAAFVELDDAKLKKKDDVVNYSIFAAGTFANLMLTFVIMLLLSAVFAPVSSVFFREEGVALKSVEQGSPAAAAGLLSGMRIKSVDGLAVGSLREAFEALQFTRPNQTVVFGSGKEDFAVVAGSNEKFPRRGYFGIVMEPVIRNKGTVYFSIFSWLQGLLALTATLSFGIGLANMIPVGPLDGGKMLHLALNRIRGEAKANKAFVRISLLLLIVILFLLSPIFKAILKSIAGIF